MTPPLILIAPVLGFPGVALGGFGAQGLHSTLEANDRVGTFETAIGRILDPYDGPVAVQSFNPLTLAWFRRHAPQHLRGQLASDFQDVQLAASKRFVLRRLLLAPVSAPHYVGYELRCLPYWAPTVARRLGIPVIAWTIRTAEEMARATRLADNYIFESVRP